MAIYKNCYPYAATYVGTYQPLLGWSSRLTRVWVNRKVSKTLENLAHLVQKDLGKAQFTVYGAKAVLEAPNIIFDDDYRWLRRVLLADKGASLKAVSAEAAAARPAEGQPVPGAPAAPPAPNLAARFHATVQNIKGVAKKPLLQRLRNFMRKSTPTIDVERQRKTTEIVLAAASQRTLLADYLQDALQPRAKLYNHKAWWADEFASLGYWKTQSQRQFVVSPIGLLDLFRHYYYDFGSFLGPPVEHLWVPPSATTEFSELSSRTEYKFREAETTVETRLATEVIQSEKSELAEEVERQTQEDFRTGITGEGGVNFAVWHAGGTSELEYATSVQNSQRTARKNSKEVTTKAVTEMRHTTRTLTREAVETRDESSRRHEVKNTSPQPVNYELRRKYQRIGVELQHLGTQLCWQLYVDEPGKDLGLAELVHVAKPEDFETTPPPDLAPPTFSILESDFQFNIPFKVTSGGDGDDNGDYVDGHNDSLGGDSNIETDFYFKAPPPQVGYELAGVTERSFDRTTTDHDPPSLWTTEYSVTSREEGRFMCYLAAVNFEKQPAIKVTVRLLWEPATAIVDAAMNAYKAKINAFEQKVQRQAEEALVDALRERIEYARSVSPRASDDLREEERTALYRRVLERLIGDDMADNPHLASELLRTFFEFDKMLYFVAPDWWNPRMQKHRGGLTVPEIFTPQGGDAPIPLGASQRVRFDREQDSREDNYFITESSDRAPLGSSIGWILQLDGDRHRNAFLNCAWAKIVIPVARGQEKKALKWLLQAEVEGVEGLNADYLDKDGKVVPAVVAAPNPARNMSVREKLEDLVEKLTAVSADPDAGFLATQTVFETGFNPLANAFKIPGKPLERFAQWVEVLPTNQVVPVTYTPPKPCGNAGN